MGFRNINIIIRREYLNRIKKKSFLIITFLGPILFAALCILPSVIMMATKEQAQRIAVIDGSSIVLPFLEDTETVKYVDCSLMSVDSVKKNMASMGIDAVLSISALNEEERTVTAEVFSKKPLGIDMTENISRKINDAVEAYRIKQYNIENLENILKEVRPDIHLRSFTMDSDGKETISESGVYMLVSMLLGMIVYMFIALFCGMVMSSVIEEKSSRVVEVLVSSVKSTELMFGKIFGVALVALTQFVLWIVLTAILVSAAYLLVGSKMDLASLMTDPMVTSAMGDSSAIAVSAPSELSVVLTTLANLPFGQIVFAFIMFFVFGYLLYASVFAAIGSAVENEGDSQQLQLPVTIPLLLGFFIAIYAFKAPDSAIVFWGSMIPFTSPIVMLARIPFGVPGWELALSLALLVVTFAALAFVSAKIYKVGILMFGKKSTWKDLWKWLKQ